MLIALLAYLGGMLTIVSPCILPVLPFVFANAGRSFRRGAVPMLSGMALTFAIVATLAAVGGSWAVRANEVGRWAALVLLAIFGLALVFPAISDRATRPLVALGSRLSNRTGEESIWSSLILGIATGLLWAPCAGPILGIIFTAAAIQGATLGTTFLLLAYALGAATSLGLALLVGGKVFQRMKGSLHATEWVRRALGVLVIVGVIAIAIGVDTRLLSKLSSAQTASLETGIAQKLGLGGSAQEGPKVGAAGQLMLPVEGALPSLEGLGPWINSKPLSMKDLKGKVVVIDFWTYSCINCIRSIPYVRAWYERYRDDGLVVIGVHAPEFAFERNPENVIQAVQNFDIRYPVALDNDYVAWKALNNRYWPAHYFFDAQGRQRYHHFGEGGYQDSEMVIRQLLAEAGRAPKAGGMAQTSARGAEAGAAFGALNSPETYFGFQRAERFASPGGQVPNRPKTYAGAPLLLNQWSLDGQWVVGAQSARSTAAPGAIAYQFHARDLHLVLGSTTGLPIRFRVTIDGRPPGPHAGVDVKPDGTGEVTDVRLYQLVRQKGDVRNRTFSIEFLDPGVEAFAFTFG
jgi:cytochrome c biogenesis protein CcdA/thiol-disulfide isomerase/thioredoxin